MEIKAFKELFKDRSAIDLNDNYVIFDDLELYNKEDDKSIQYTTFEDLLEYKIGDLTIKNIIENTDSFDVQLNGGRGASVGKGKKLFTGAGKKGNKKIIGLYESGGNSYPSYLNARTGARYKSQEKTIKEFARMMDKETVEYSASLDEQGYATKYNKGDSGSTAFLSLKNGMVIHNHPVYDKKGKQVAWNTFSKEDLLAVARDKNGTRGIIAVANGNKSVYKFARKKGFKAKEFEKGLNNARMTSNNYDKDVDAWLRKNAKKYNYTYSRTKYTTTKRK